MSTPTSPTEHKLPSRSGTVSSSMTRRTSISDDEAIPDTDSSEVCGGSWGGLTAVQTTAFTPQCNSGK